MYQGRERTQLERLTFFSDAVFAIAMTLLVVEIHLPHVDAFTDRALAHGLFVLLPNYIGFLVSFLVLARFWATHHMIMGELKATTPRLVWINLFLLLAVAFMPFPTAVISRYVQLRVGIGFYAAWLMLLGLLNHWLIRTAKAGALIDDDIDPAIFDEHLRASWIPVLIAAGALATGMIEPLLAPVALVVGTPLISRLMRRRKVT